MIRQIKRWNPIKRSYLPAVILFVLALLIWEIGVALLKIPQFMLPQPSRIGGSFIENWETLLLAGRMTLIESLGGILIGGTLAIAAALIASYWGVAGRALIPFAVAFNAVPTIIFAPIMNNWFGSINPLSNMMVVVTLVYYPIMINVYRGLTRLDRPRLELMQSLGASERDIFTKLQLPNALPYFFNALKLAATLSVIGTVVAGYFGGPLAALGVWILNQAVYFKFTSAWAGIAVACAIGIFFYLIITIIEHRVISWHESIRSSKH